MEFKVYIGNGKRRAKSVEFFYHIARRAGLSCPLGRALYAANRVLNGDWSGCSGALRGEGDDQFRRTMSLRNMRTIKESTAKRWLAHYQAGGSLKALCYTQDQWLAKRKTGQARREANYAYVRNEG